MKYEELIPEGLRRVTTQLAEGFVREGLLCLPDLTDEQLDKELRSLIFRFLREGEFDAPLTFDTHTHKLFALARSLESEHDLELTSLFYMLWIEHRINLILRVMLRRKSFSEKDAVAIVRKLNVREKLTWLWQFLDLSRLSEQVLADISTIEEFRNGFVHYKWLSFTSFDQEDRAWQAINRVDAIISALQQIEDSHVFFGQRHRCAESAQRLKDA